MSVSLLVVNYRSAALAAEAVRSARAATSGALQVVIVDNSVDANEAEALRAFADVVIASESNAGYAAAINRGRHACAGDVIVVSNPDVVFAPGSIDALVAANAAVAGPALFWDDAHEWLLPPADLHTFRDRLDRVLATRWPVWQRRRDRRRFRQRVAFWSLRDTTRVDALSGAVMAIRAAAFDAAGGFDERFRLYFEETDFLRRVRGDIVYVPAARVRHLYNQSAAGSPEAAQLYAESERAYLRKWHGVILECGGKAPAFEPLSAAPMPPNSIVVEASPLADFETAAGHFPQSNDYELPTEVLASYRGEALYLRVVDRESGDVLARTKILP